MLHDGDMDDEDEDDGDKEFNLYQIEVHNIDIIIAFMKRNTNKFFF